MKTVITPDPKTMGRYVAEHAAEVLKAAIQSRGEARLIVATGASQFEVLGQLIEQPGIAWDKVHGFHLDEYVGVGDEHPASFCKYLKERFVQRVPLASFHFLDGEADPESTIAEANQKISAAPIDLALVGIGENGHLAFNDPPADFDTEEPYIIVELDEPCRLQQVGEGWFDSLESVPTRAISMSIRQILKSGTIFCSVPDERKAKAVHDTLSGEITHEVPASALRNHPQTTLVIDQAAASALSESQRASVESFA